MFCLLQDTHEPSLVSSPTTMSLQTEQKYDGAIESQSPDYISNTTRRNLKHSKTFGTQSAFISSTKTACLLQYF
jgi:hypothetical protein